MYPDLLILCATAHEAAPFLAQYPDSHECVSKTGVRILEGKIGGCFYQLALTGPGVFNTAHALTVLLEHQTPGLILQTGIAGVFKASGLGIGDVAVGTQARYIHTGVIRSPDQITPLPFDLINERVTTRQGVYETDPGLLGRCLDRLIQEFLQTGVIVRKGSILTVSGITAGTRGADHIFKLFNPLMEAMEGAAAAHVAALYRIPFIEIRVASNEAGQRDKSQWEIPLAAGRIPLICRAVSDI